MNNMIRAKKAFTLVELLVATSLFLMAMSVALFATLGSNGLINRTETRSNLVEGVRETVDAMRRSAEHRTVKSVSMIESVSYPVDGSGNPSSDIPLSVVTLSSASTSSSFAMQVKRFSASQGENICQLIGRTKVVTTSANESLYLFDPEGETVSTQTFRMNAANICEYSSLLYRGKLTDLGLKVANYSLILKTTDYSCGLLTCSIGQIRYHLTLEAQKSKDRSTPQRPPGIDTVGSVAILTPVDNSPPSLSSISLTPSGTLGMQTGGTQQFAVTALYTDGSSSDITTSAGFTENDPSGSISTSGLYTAGSTEGTYSIYATYLGKQTNSVNVVLGTSGGGRSLTSVSISPTSVTVSSSATASFTAYAHYDNGDIENITSLAAFAANVGSFSANQYTAPGSAGQDQARATFGGFTSSPAEITISSGGGGSGGGGAGPGEL